MNDHEAAVTGVGGDVPAVPLIMIKNRASHHEVAAVAAVFQALAPHDRQEPGGPVSEWAAHHRRLRPSFPSGRGGWRSSSLPR